MKSVAMFTTGHYQEKDGSYRGYVKNKDDRAVIWTDRTFKKPEQAERNAHSTFRLSIYNCQHEWLLDANEEAETNSWGGTDYITQSKCLKCGLVQYFVSRRSIYDYD